MNREQGHDGDLTDEEPTGSAAEGGAAAEDGDEEYGLAPPGPELTAWDKAIQKQFDEDARRPAFVPVDMPEDTVRFSVRQVFVLTALAAVLLVGLRYIRADIFAGVLGIVAFLGLVTLSIIKPKADILYVCWWVLLLVYLIIAVAAVARS